MTNLTKQARETIKNWYWYVGEKPPTIAGYIRHHYPDGKWQGDRCGCPDDRCIGYHHFNEDDCGCLEPCLDMYMAAIRPDRTDEVTHSDVAGRTVTG